MKTSPLCENLIFEGSRDRQQQNRMSVNLRAASCDASSLLFKVHDST